MRAEVGNHVGYVYLGKQNWTVEMDLQIKTVVNNLTSTINMFHVRLFQIVFNLL